jgi:hypothetical protein
VVHNIFLVAFTIMFRLFRYKMILGFFQEKVFAENIFQCLACAKNHKFFFFYIFIQSY